jgi:hypothetical protein
MLFSHSKTNGPLSSPHGRSRGLHCLFRLAILVVMFSSFSLRAEQPDEIFIEGTDFSKRVTTHSRDKTDLTQLESISNIEIFYWYGCESCYQFEAELQNYLALHPEVSVRRTPLIARPAWRFQANLQAIMQQLPAQAENLPVSDLYLACLQDCRVFSSFENNKAWLSEAMQLSEFPVLDMNRLWEVEKNYQKRADLFSITQVPTIIINETFKINANQAKTSARMITIADYLLSSEIQ